MRWSALALLLVFFGMDAERARAQADTGPAEALREAREAIELADFPLAVQALDRAAQMDLGASLLEWLELQALLAFADDRLGATEEALAGWASIAPPEAASPATFPPALRRRLDELRGAAAIRLVVVPALAMEGGVRTLSLPVQTLDDPGHLIRSIEVMVSIAGEAAVALEAGESRALVGDPHADLDIAYWVTARGPGGAIVHQSGSASAPTEETLPGLPRSNDDTVLAIVLTSAGVAIAGALVVGFGVSEDWWRGDTTTVRGPTAALLRF